MNLQDFFNSHSVSKDSKIKISKEEAESIREAALGDSYQIIKYLEQKSKEQEIENQKNYKVSFWAMIFGAISAIGVLLQIIEYLSLLSQD